MKELFILAVDDRAENLFLLEELLAEHLPECRIVKTQSPEEGLEIAEKEQIAGAILDLQMPGIDGIEMCRRMKANPATAHVPVVLVTAHKSEPGRRIQALEAGADDFISKPISGVEMVAKIKVMLRLKRAEEELREANARLEEIIAERTQSLREETQLVREIVGSAQEGIVVYGPDLLYRVWNPFMERISGVPASDVLGRHPLEVFPFLQEAKVFERLEQALAGATPKNVDLSYPSPDGRLGWFSDRSGPLHNEKGEIIGVIGTIHDITERKLAEGRLERAEEQSRAMLENSPSCTKVVDLDLNLQYMSPAGVSALKIEDTAQIYGKPYPFDFYPESFRRQMTGNLKRALDTGEVITQEAAVEDVEGNEIWYHSTIVPVRATDGPIEYLLVVSIDTTERKRAEEEQGKLEAQLNQAQKLESVGRLAGGVAHDFNNMLSVILGYADMALSGMDASDPLYHAFTEIEQAGNRSADLTRQLLAFARKQVVAPKVLDLNEVSQSMLTMLRRLIGEDIDLVWKPGAEIWPVNMDPAQVDQMLANLCVNARDAISGVGTVTIETENVTLDEDSVAAQPDLRSGDFVMLAVSDDGCGMNDDTKEHLFEPFYTTKGVGEGTGLGLATVYGITKQNDGFVTVYSEVGEGTIFKIYIPRHVGEAEEATGSEPDARPRGQGETVLLVEDEATVLKVGSAMLSKLGYTVLTAGSPGEALALMASHAGKIDLLMTDVVMPEMNGRELADQLRSQSPGLRCLFVSGYTADVILNHGLLNEGVQFLQKPFTASSLAVAVKEALRVG